MIFHTITSGTPIKEQGATIFVTPLGVRTYVGPTGVRGETPQATRARIDALVTNRFDDPRYYSGDAAS